MIKLVILLVCLSVGSSRQVCPRIASLGFAGEINIIHLQSEQNNLSIKLREKSHNSYDFSIQKWEQSITLNEFELITMVSQHGFKNISDITRKLQYKFNDLKYHSECVNSNIDLGNLSLQVCRIGNHWIFGFIRNSEKIWFSYQDFLFIGREMNNATEKLIINHIICDVRTDV